MEQCNKSYGLRERLEAIQRRMDEAALRAGRLPRSVRLVAVSKGQDVQRILELADAGIDDFGENYLQEWERKAHEIRRIRPDRAERIRWHFIGHLQSNKARAVAGAASLIHSVDSLRLAARLSQTAAEKGIVQAVLWEIKLAEETSKGGVYPEDWLRDLKQYAALPNLEWRGLMALPPPAPDGVSSTPFFGRLKSLLDEGNRTGVLKQAMTELSMGMSQDFPEAIAAGATLIRVGSALFGPRA